VSKPFKGFPLIRRQLSPSMERIEGSILSELWNPLHDNFISLCWQEQLLITVTFHSGCPPISLPVLAVPMLMLFKEQSQDPDQKVLRIMQKEEIREKIMVKLQKGWRKIKTLEKWQSILPLMIRKRKMMEVRNLKVVVVGADDVLVVAMSLVIHSYGWLWLYD